MRLDPHRWLRWLGALACVAVTAGPAAAALSPDETRLVRRIEAGFPAAAERLRRAVDQNSGTMHFAGVRAVAEMFAPEFERLGFTTRWVDGAPWGRAGHLLAERRGRPGAPRVLMIGHLDTVFEPDSPFQRWSLRADSTVHGPGVSDMKGGIVVMQMALLALAGERQLDRLDVSVVLTGDEEKPGRPLELARRDLIDAARRADIALGFEDGDGNPAHAVVARRGSGSWVLRVRGTPSHSSQVFQPGVGEGAIMGAARILTAFRDSLRGEAMLTLNPGLVVGGTAIEFDGEAARGSAFGKTNVVAESTVVTGDLRPLTFLQREDAQAAMRRIAAAPREGVWAEVSFDDSYPPLAPSAGNQALLARYDAASRDLGLGPITATDPRRAGAADISFTAGLTPMALDALGLKGGGGHTVEEWADLRALPRQAARVAVMLSRIAREGRSALSSR